MAEPRPPRIKDSSEVPSNVRIPAALNWYLWRPVAAGKAQYGEIENDWTLADLAQCHILLDLQEDAETEARIRARHKTRG